MADTVFADEFAQAYDAREQEQQEGVRRARVREAATSIIARLETIANDHVRRRRPIELVWLSALRAYHGRYDDVVERELMAAERAGKPRARAYVKLARAKSDAWEARMFDLLFPSDEKNWGIEETPVPLLTDGSKQALAQALAAEQQAMDATQAANAAAQAGQSPDAHIAEAAMSGAQLVEARTQAQQLQDEVDEVRKRAELMQKEIEDQFIECDYPKRARDAIRNGVRLGIGVLKGPLVANRPARRWANVGGAHQLQHSPDQRPEVRSIDPWNFFPDDSATSMEDAEFTFERYFPGKQTLRRLARTLNFDTDSIAELLKEGPTAGLGETEFLTSLRAVSNDYDAEISGRYLMWEYNGPLETVEIATLLEAAGESERAAEMLRDEDPMAENMVTMHFCQGRLLKLADQYVMDSGETLYSTFAFAPGEASIMDASGVPGLMLDSLRVLNGAWRMMIDNGAMSALPQVVRDRRRIVGADGDNEIRPGKLWDVVGESMPHESPPFQVFNIVNNQGALAGIVEMALKFIDEETSLPLISQGEQGSHITQTASGMSMLFNSANVIFRRAVKCWDDDMTTPVVRRFYDWNMQFNPKEEIKGDMQIKAVGTSVLLVREMQAQNLLMIARDWSVHPVLSHALKSGGYAAARAAVQSMSMGPTSIMVSEDEFEENLKNLAASASEQMSPDVMRAQATVQAATIQAESRQKSDETAKEIAMLRRETELIQLAQQNNMTLEALQAKLAMHKTEMDSKERIFAAEAAIQSEAREQAAALGQQAPGGGGGTL
jgi:hypothetical protein